VSGQMGVARPKRTLLAGACILVAGTLSTALVILHQEYSTYSSRVTAMLASLPPGERQPPPGFPEAVARVHHQGVTRFVAMRLLAGLHGQPESHLRRSYQEFVWTLLLPRTRSPREILALYAHTMACEAGKGLEAGASYYFAKPAARLTDREALTLVIMDLSPNAYSARRNPERLKQVLDRLTPGSEEGSMDVDPAPTLEPVREALLRAIAGDDAHKPPYFTAYCIAVIPGEATPSGSREERLRSVSGDAAPDALPSLLSRLGDLPHRFVPASGCMKTDGDWDIVLRATKRKPALGVVLGPVRVVSEDRAEVDVFTTSGFLTETITAFSLRCGRDGRWQVTKEEILLQA
jgi:hypothetical protein